MGALAIVINQISPYGSSVDKTVANDRDGDGIEIVCVGMWEPKVNMSAVFAAGNITVEITPGKRVARPTFFSHFLKRSVNSLNLDYGFHTRLSLAYTIFFAASYPRINSIYSEVGKHGGQ